MAVDRHIHSQVGFPTRCIFCDSLGPLTEEDWWPKWLTRFKPSPFDSQKHTTKLSNSKDFEKRHFGEIAPTWKARGALYSPLKVVCKSCNTGWMSKIQKKVTPYLKPLILGNWQPFDEVSQYAIASWITMLCMVYDFRSIPTQNITQGEREFLKSNGFPPPGWIISYGFLKDDEIHGKIWKQSMLVSDRVDDAITDKPNMQTTTVAIGRLLLHAFGTCEPYRYVTPPDIRDSISLEVIWPAISWPIRAPARKISSHTGFNLVAEGIRHMIQGRD